MLDLQPLWPRAFVVFQQAVSSLRGSEAQRCSELSGRCSPGPRRNRKRGARPTQKPSAPQSTIWQSLGRAQRKRALQGFGGACGHASKNGTGLEADKLAKRQARTPEVAVQAAFSASKIAMPRWPSRRPRSPSWKRQPRKQLRQWRRPSRRRRNCKGNRQAIERVRRGAGSPYQVFRSSLQFTEQRACGVPGPFWESRSPASHCSVGICFHRPFRFAGGCNANPHGDRGARRRGIAAGQREGHLARGVGRCRAFERSLQGLPRKSERPRKQRWWSSSSKRGKFSHLKRHINTSLLCV